MKKLTSVALTAVLILTTAVVFAQTPPDKNANGMMDKGNMMGQGGMMGGGEMGKDMMGEGMMMHEEDKIKLLNDSAAALAQLNPGLSAKLAQFSKEEAAEKGEKGEEKKELAGAKAEQMKARREEHIKLFRDSAAALGKSNPDLALRLTKMADHMQKKMNMMEK